MSLTLLASNNASTVLASSINASATTLTVNTGAGSLFPSPVAGTSFFKLTLIDAATGQLTEIVHVTARTGDVMTIERAQEGTSARVWSANDIAANMMTAGTLSYILGSFQPLDATLTALAALTGAADKLPYFNGADTAALTALTAVGRNIIGKSSISDVLTYLGLGAGAPAIGIPFFWPSSAMPNTVMPEWADMVFLKLNDATFSATTYPKLALVWPGLKLTDTRGEFIRIWDDGRGVDSGRTLLSSQGDAIRNIKGGLYGGTAKADQFLGDAVTADGAFYLAGTGSKVAIQGEGASTGYGADSALFDASRFVPTASENRPRNIAFNFLVRAK